ncbi:D-3-phosphoglycerate dehydrogenase [Helicobacter heilmannii]|uniref:phosphoglycerate dehydrogenase n=1 Tax=Helicobacter heilmannii TaxID=35817 RepID=UPI0006A243E5|nr:phosphoglycerate dehydrogenase [Helicobacter heilmannii]CRF51409.1 D-3-phosphoglycerate dehydrogenase [Helicobacter heilmannii]
MPKIAICDPIHEGGVRLLCEHADLEVLDFSTLEKAALPEAIREVDALITRSMTAVNAHLLAHTTKLKAIVRAGVGVDNVDIDLCSQKGIVVMNVPTANTIAAVELTMAHMLNAVRRLPGANTQLKHEHLWKREDWYGTELYGKKLGIIGFGNIGSRVGVRALAFGMEVLTYDPYIPKSKATDLGVLYTKDFKDILACDIITIHTPKNKETINIIDREQIAQMKEGVILINCARGGLYNEEALYAALKSKKVRWLGIDVFSKEPGTNNPLLELDNVYGTPHIGANTYESQAQIAKEAAQAVIESLRGSSYPNALNIPIQDNIAPYAKPYLQLAQKLGFFCAQVHKGAWSALELTLAGPICEYGNSLLTFALMGLLKPSLGDKINYVNAPHVASERNIHLTTKTLEDATPYTNFITLQLSAPHYSTQISATAFSDDILKITNIDGFEMDVKPQGTMILFKNTDKPGVIGNVGHTLAKHNINIADFRLGRNAKAEALAAILVDAPIGPNILHDLQEVPHCLGVSVVSI